MTVSILTPNHIFPDSCTNAYPALFSLNKHFPIRSLGDTGLPPPSIPRAGRHRLHHRHRKMICGGPTRASRSLPFEMIFSIDGSQPLVRCYRVRSRDYYLRGSHSPKQSCIKTNTYRVCVAPRKEGNPASFFFVSFQRGARVTYLLNSITVIPTW